MLIRKIIREEGLVRRGGEDDLWPAVLQVVQEFHTYRPKPNKERLVFMFRYILQLLCACLKKHSKTGFSQTFYINASYYGLHFKLTAIFSDLHIKM